MAALRLFSRCLAHTKYDSVPNIAPVSIIFNRTLKYLSKEYNENDPAPLFFNNEIQSLLKTLTRVNLNKVYRKRKLGQKKLDLPKYKFVTDEQLQQMVKDAEIKTEEILQMPPVLKVRGVRDQVLSRDPALEGYDTATYIFTDITFGIKNIDRIIIAREPDGTLREADWPLRDRMNQVYFPLHGRDLKVPPMFKDNYLEKLLSKKEYEFILDRSCMQFEPDDIEYQKVTTVTYQHVNDSNGFEILRSTRHFGPLAFFLLWHKEIDNLLLDLIQSSQIQEANVLVQLYGKFHKVELNVTDIQSTEAVEKYIKEFSNKRASLELAVQAYKELEQEKKQIEHDIKHVHGVA
ncbi:mitochondrial 28s ribosomal protein s22 [Holotrichia oblita]|uniref:Mitochondrial 28s ribosomal protein s22 n=1 Tax=Holotrichia oblita TaxID=644536 RepID=A0ACB9TG71_HOLOL|nr:mitochondrial 28s ribosomal protein s22 [Holotrichia oblita]